MGLSNNIDRRMRLLPKQTVFFDSPMRFPAFVGGVGTGKTMVGILRMMRLMMEAPNNLGLIVRKEFTDLRDSLMKDFELYTGLTIEKTEKQVQLPNGSVIMFRHGSELNVLKNINLGAILIEQAEEFETDEVFNFCRDRLRRKEAKSRSISIIANANGHNWIWRLWKNNPGSEFDLTEMTSFENPHLPDDFVEDLRRMEKDSPNHFRRFVLNSWEDVDSADLVLPYMMIDRANKNSIVLDDSMTVKLYGVDVAKYDDDRTVHIIFQRGLGGWKQILKEGYTGKKLDFTMGRIMQNARRFGPDEIQIDAIGMGEGVYDVVSSEVKNVHMYKGSYKSTNKLYLNKRSEDIYGLRRLFERGEIQLIPDEDQDQDLSVLRYEYRKAGRVLNVISKDVLKSKGIRSPDYADAIAMALSGSRKYEVVGAGVESWRDRSQRSKRYAGYAGGW